MHKLMLIAALGTLGFGCKKKDEGAAADKSGAADKGAADKGGSLPALTAEPAPGDITPADKPPFESIKLRMLDKREANGWPKYELYNLGTKPVTFAAIYGYAYDKDGKQVARTRTPLSWNGKAEPGKKASWDLSIGMPDEKVPATATSFATCYSSIKFEGDAEQTMDDARCPEEMPKP